MINLLDHGYKKKYDWGYDGPTVFPATVQHVRSTTTRGSEYMNSDHHIAKLGQILMINNYKK